jgi:hypothetical protein
LIKNPERAFHDLGLAATKYVIFVGNLCTDRQAWQQVGDALKEFLQLPAEERTRIVMRCCSSLKIAPKLARTALEFGCQKGLSLLQKRQLLARLDRLGKQAGTEISKFIKDIQREAARVGKTPQAQTLEGIEIPVPNAEGLTAFMEGEEVAHEAARLCPAEEVKPITEAAEKVKHTAKLQEGAAAESKAGAQGMQAAEDAAAKAKALADKAGAEGRAVQEMREGVQETERIQVVGEKQKPVAEGVPGEPVPVVEEKLQPAVEQDPAHEVHAEAAAEARAIEVQEVLDYNAQYKTQACDKAQRLKVEFLEYKLPHILADRPGHLPDTPTNRQLLLDVASDPRNYFACSDARGSIWCEKILEDGSQVWVQIYNGYIRNAGLNIKPRKWDPVTGLARNVKKIN